MSQKISSGLALTLIFGIAGTIGLLLWLGNERGLSVDDPRFFAFEKPEGNHNWLKGKDGMTDEEEELGDRNFCTMEAKECPDGSFVGRNSDDNCEFYPCPEGIASDDEFYCEKDADCEPLVFECGHCADYSIAVNKKYSEKYTDEYLGKCQGNTRWCDSVPPGEAKCFENKCILKK